MARAPISLYAADVSSRPTEDLISRERLRQILGVLWLVDGLLQLQPSMFTRNLVDGIMLPATQGQPGPIAAVLHTSIRLTSQHIVLANLGIFLVQVVLGSCLLSGRFVRPALQASVGWALLVWFGGEGMGMVLTGQASALTGAPGAVLLYAILGLAAYPRDSSSSRDLMSRGHLRLTLAGFWALTAVLQMQPVWWQPHQISQIIAGNEQLGTLNGALFGGSLEWFAQLTVDGETFLNSFIIVLALSLAVGLFLMRHRHVRPVLAVSILASLVLWWATEACGQLLSGSATDPNSGPLLVVLALACWPVMRQASESSRQSRVAMRRDLATSISST